MNKKNILVFSRQKAREYTALDIPKCIIISINSSEKDDEELNQFYQNKSILAILYERFDDIDYDGSTGITLEQGKEIADFVKQWIYSVDTIVVHCTYGQSRSAGVGAAIMEWANDDITPILGENFRPNRRCYNFVLDALRDNSNNTTETQ